MELSQFFENQGLAHLFMICSNIKLTSPRESIGIALLFFVCFFASNSNGFGGALNTRAYLAKNNMRKIP
jgi:hypothetical protein